MSTRRLFIKTAVLPVAASAMVFADKSIAADCPCNLLVIGPGGDFDNVADALGASP